MCTQDRLEASLSLEDSPPPRLNLSLIVAVPRPQTVKKIIQLAAATGIGRLDFVRTEKVVPSYLQSKSLIPEAIETEVLKGLQQACDTISPKIAVHENFKSYLGKLNFLQGALCLIADNQFGDKARSTVQTPSSIHPTHIILAIGPESGWTKQEYDQLVERSFKPISLGKRMYRSEQALALLIGQLISSFGLLKEQK
ncbi:MAG: hypothetical protein DCC75_05265 [Proteobacteria bacterium]|nr:MAG: hypothetical protein DCC75_05265 [Pseudomonadota bacterium]